MIKFSEFIAMVCGKTGMSLGLLGKYLILLTDFQPLLLPTFFLQTFLNLENVQWRIKRGI